MINYIFSNKNWSEMTYIKIVAHVTRKLHF